MLLNVVCRHQNVSSAFVSLVICEIRALGESTATVDYNYNNEYGDFIGV